MVKAIMHGCNGKMGQVITGLIKNDNMIEIVAGIDKYQEIQNDYPVFDSLKECNIEADVVIDFSNVTAMEELLEVCEEKQLPVVLCTTGLSEEQLEKVQKASERTAILRSANMSLGVNLLMKLLQEAAKVLSPAGFDIEIVEKHHNLKKDAPSGTAIMIAEALNNELDNKMTYVYDRHNVRRAREANEIGMHAIRGGTIVGEHDIIFAGHDEVITLSHSAASKEVFAAGSINAAVFIAGKESGLYDMSDLLKNA